MSEITGSSYNFKEKPQGMEHSPEPVGTAHRKINPMQVNLLRFENNVKHLDVSAGS